MRLFLIVAFGLSWLVALPLWLGDGLASPAMPLIGLAMMYTPTLGVLAVWLRERTPARRWARETGLTLGERRGRTIGLIAAGWFGPSLIGLAAVALSVAVGVLKVDLGGFSLFRAMLGSAPVDPAVLAVSQTVSAALIVPLINSLAAFGEEWGWRGWLLPRLVASRGVLGGLLLSGVIWGLWHAPLTLLGYNYPSLGPWAALYFVGFCVLSGILLGWLRLKSGSVWPAVIGHGAINAVGPLILVYGDASAPPNLTLAGLTGLAGWALLAALSVLVLKLWPVRQAQPVS
ncbi:CPBP family intramembrane glutamic endopeptidase [Nonomuraea sp. NPDC046570]|uniref:CPBP family intramembrane glutamic endopeptidase n=1 Tax=Nonomuraea sp. NPDC046570 TaxID=3155255 RepID=UPI0033FA36E0